MMSHLITEDILSLFCEKNSDGTKNLRLKGKELQQRFETRLDNEDMYKVTDFISKHPEIININLCYNDIGDDGLAILCDKILNCTDFNVVILNLLHCNLSWRSVKKLCQVSASFKMKTLRLAGNYLGPKGAYYIVRLLRTYPNLLYLDLGDTNQIANSIEPILMCARFTHLKVLNISRIIVKNQSQFIAENIAELLRITNHLEELHVQKCELNAHDIEIITKYGLEFNENLLFLDLAYNHMGDYGLDVLSKWLKPQKKLLGLNIAGNRINNSGALSLSQFMPFSRLRFLDISDNRIGDDGMVAIMKTLKKRYPIRILYIWGNLFGDNTKVVIDRLLRAKILIQEQIDVKIYCVERKLYTARYPANRYKHKYYDIMDYGCPVELLIKKNQIVYDNQSPRALIQFKHIERYPCI